MATIRPFRGLRFSNAAGSIEDLVAPPYDVLSKEERDALWGGGWEHFEEKLKQIKKHLESEIAISLVDGRGTESFAFHGSLSAWTLTNATYRIPGSNSTLWISGFDASAWRSYKLKIKVIKPVINGARYHPKIFFHGIDDGYFDLGVLLDNIALIVLINIAAAVAFLSRWIVRRIKGRT